MNLFFTYAIEFSGRWAIFSRECKFHQLDQNRQSARNTLIIRLILKQWLIEPSLQRIILLETMLTSADIAREDINYKREIDR
jgi:hypothetical protein